MELSAEEVAIIKKVLASKVLQYLIGAEEWDLTEAEEMRLWEIIKRENLLCD